MAKLLSNPKINVSAEQLSINMLSAALLALEEAGNIIFETAKVDNIEEDQLMVLPTGTPVNFPVKSLEYRLYIFAPATVSAIIYEWLGNECLDPWELSVTMGNILLSIRKLAIVKTEVTTQEEFRLSEQGKVAITNNELECKRVISLLQTCKVNRPVIWALMEKEISTGILRRKYIKRDQNDPFSDPDPWDKEAEIDREQLLTEYAKPDLLSRISGYLIGLFAWVAWASLVGISHQEVSDSYFEYHLAADIIGGFILLYVLKDLKFAPVVNLFNLINDALRSKKIKRFQQEEKPLYEKILDRLAMVPIVGGLIHLIIYYMNQYPTAFLLLIGAIFAGIYWLLKMKTKDAINERVLGKPKHKSIQEQQPIELQNAGSSNLVINTPVEQVPVKIWKNPVSLNIINSTALPPVSDAGMQRLAAITKRGPSYFNICKQLLFRMCTVFVIIAMLYWSFFRTPLIFPWDEEGSFPSNIFFFLLFYAFTMMMLNRKLSAWLSDNIKIAFGKLLLKSLLGIDISDSSSTSYSETKEHESSLRPKLMIYLIWIWFLLIMFITGNKFTEIHNFLIRFLFCVGSMSIVIYAYIWFKKQRSNLEQKYPFQTPVNLLALRVFGSPYLTDFLRLTKSWQWMGTTQRLDGPETTGDKGMDIIHYLTGQIDKSIVENQEELESAFKKFNASPDKKLCFTLNSMQCMDATWKEALQYLLNKSDVVVMDFSYLSEKNKGVAFELNKLFDQFETKRLVFLVNDSTDMKVLEEISNQAWDNRSDSSPNLNVTSATINCYHTGVMPTQKANESYYDWKKRFEVNIDGDHLVGLIYDSSQPSRSPVMPPDPVKYWHSIHWTSLTMSLKLQFLIKLAVSVYFISLLYITLSAVFSKVN
jgi:hypothetical protein